MKIPTPTGKIIIAPPLKRKLNKILNYLEDSEYDHFLGCLGEKGYKNHIFFDAIELKRALSNKKPKCVQCNRAPPNTEDGLFCNDCIENIGLKLDKTGKYVFPDWIT